MSKGRKRKQLTLPHVPPAPKRATRGNPVLAFRVDGPLLRAYFKKHGGKEPAYTALRRHMQTTTRAERSQ
jgi:hypothetical protein